jgi:hypothetical protein
MDGRNDGDLSSPSCRGPDHIRTIPVGVSDLGVHCTKATDELSSFPKVRPRRKVNGVHVDVFGETVEEGMILCPLVEDRDEVDLRACGRQDPGQVGDDLLCSADRGGCQDVYDSH